MFTSDTFSRRVARLQELLVRREVDLAVLHYATDLHYYAGTIQPLYLLIPREGAPVLVARKSIARLREEAPHLEVRPFTDSASLAAAFAAVGAPAATRVACTLDTIAYGTVQRLQKQFPAAELVDLAWDIRLLRMVKEPEEIAIFKQAGELAAGMDAWMHTHFTPGMTELELTALLEYECRRRGSAMLVRARREGMEMSACGVCSAGPNTMAGSKFEGVCGGAGLSTAVPYGASAQPIPRGVSILVDYAFILNGYHLDQTRNACWGAPPAALADAYAAMVEIEDAVFAALRPGVPWEEPYRLAVERAAALGYAEGFMGLGAEQVRFVGHGVGLELDEPPVMAPKMRDPLAAGMVVAIEPKVALPEYGIVGIEDTVVIREDGIERLTVCPRALVVLS